MVLSWFNGLSQGHQRKLSSCIKKVRLSVLDSRVSGERPSYDIFTRVCFLMATSLFLSKDSGNEVIFMAYLNFARAQLSSFERLKSKLAEHFGPFKTLDIQADLSK